MSDAAVFPGQGTQHVGMGRALLGAYPAGEARYERASELLGFDLAEACWRGEAAALTATRLAQPAIFVTNAAAFDALRHWGIEPRFVAGHSVGELCALYAAGVLDFDTALDVVRVRAELMASVQADGAMYAVIGLDEIDVLAACTDVRDHGPVGIGLHNAPANYVISGAAPAAAAAADRCRAAGAIRVTRLRTQHAFHSPLMEPVADRWRAFVDRIALREPAFPVALNTTGAFASDIDDIRRAIVDQVASTVRWAECVDTLVAAGARRLVEVGDSKVLATLARSAHRELETVTMQDPRARRRLAATATGGAALAVS